ncbi:cell envelope integrity protein TolA [Sphingobacterium sp. SYP-B4668]|uniref:cell envelope integrity protein TolA n=1 Tax=Sphingobacterium sp. SYP-B4668 TaxID=2996035 RepID=UPI0022DCE470|nr:cell envelope integrity protein TolA [Sphingobacterium sp. SYP-B4668]
MKITLLIVLFLINWAGTTQGQNKIDFSANFKTMSYYNSIGGDGLRSEKFFGQYRVYDHGGSLRIGIKLTVAPNSGRSYTYKGKTYTASEIPELNNIDIKTVTGALKVHDNRLKAGEKDRELEIYIGGYADQSGSLGGNNYELSSKVPKSFPNTTLIEFVPERIYFNSSDLHSAIERYIGKEKEREAAKANQQKYENLLREADRLFTAKNYDHALTQYYSASYIDVSDKTRAENGIAKTRKILGEEATEDKPKESNAHTYKNGECKLAGTVAEHYSCPLCAQQAKKETEAKAKEDKRLVDAKTAREEEARKAKAAEEKRIADEKAEAARKAKETEAKRIADEKAEREMKAKLMAQLKKNGGAGEIDLKNIKVKQEATEYVFLYNEIPINRFPKNRIKYDISNLGPTDYFYGVDPNAEVLYKGVYDNPGKSGKIILFDPLGKELTGFPDLYNYKIDENEKTIVFYQYLSTPEFLRFTTKETKRDLDYRKVLGFYTSDGAARTAVTNYRPPFEQWRDLQFFIVKVMAIVTDFNLKIVSEKEGYLLTEYHYSN